MGAQGAEAVGAANPPLLNKTHEISKSKEQNPIPLQLQQYISTGPHAYSLTTARFQISLSREVQHVALKCDYSVMCHNYSFLQMLL